MRLQTLPSCRRKAVDRRNAVISAYPKKAFYDLAVPSNIHPEPLAQLILQ